MKRTKKLFAVLLATVTMLCMGTTAFAAEGDAANTDATSVTITKKYVAANEGTISPAETFTLTQQGNGVVEDGEAASAPALGAVTGAVFAEGAAAKNGATAKITVNLPEYTSVGVYTYTLKETDNKTAGVTYYSKDIKLVVTVIQGEDGELRVAGVHTEDEGQVKSDEITNKDVKAAAVAAGDSAQALADFAKTVGDDPSTDQMTEAMDLYTTFTTSMSSLETVCNGK